MVSLTLDIALSSSWYNTVNEICTEIVVWGKSYHLYMRGFRMVIDEPINIFLCKGELQLPFKYRLWPEDQH